MSTLTISTAGEDPELSLEISCPESKPEDNSSGKTETPEQVSSLNELTKILRNFLGGTGETDLKLHIKETLIYTKDIRRILRGHRATYDPEKCILIKGMSRPLHDSIFHLASLFLTKAS